MGRNIKNRTQKVVNTVTKPVEKLLDKFVDRFLPNLKRF